MAIIVRLSEKRILHFTREEIKSMEFDAPEESIPVVSSPHKRSREGGPNGNGGSKKSRR